jgi:hypothetical protein
MATDIRSIYYGEPSGQASVGLNRLSAEQSDDFRDGQT